MGEDLGMDGTCLGRHYIGRILLWKEAVFAEGNQLCCGRAPFGQGLEVPHGKDVLGFLREAEVMGRGHQNNIVWGTNILMPSTDPAHTSNRDALCKGYGEAGGRISSV